MEDKTRQQFPLSPKKIIKKTLSIALVWGILLLIGTIILAVSLGVANGSRTPFVYTVVGGLLFYIVIIFITYLYQRWYFAVYFYDLGQDYIVIKKGPITPQEITIPYERVQDVYVDQDLLDRFFGIYDVHLSSATISSGMEAHIDGVNKQSADGLKAILLATVSERISKKKTSTS